MALTTFIQPLDSTVIWFRSRDRPARMRKASQDDTRPPSRPQRPSLTPSTVSAPSISSQNSLITSSPSTPKAKTLLAQVARSANQSRTTTPLSSPPLSPCLSKATTHHPTEAVRLAASQHRPNYGSPGSLYEASIPRQQLTWMTEYFSFPAYEKFGSVSDDVKEG